MNSSLKFLSFSSPNASRINGPLAESTAIGSPISQDASFRGNQKKRNVSPLPNTSNKVQIEPHVLTNAQSRGIVKRLVTYYDESQGDVDKKYVYNRVGDFPIVQLKKTEIKRNLVRSSSVRIAPPSKTVFNRDIRAAIIRGNSMPLGASVPKLQPTKMRAKDDSHQIITNHEPLPTDESAQTAKSVLDALEKNCRKRINNEELTMDRTKRVCATETVDGPNSKEFIPIAPQSAKRGRDQTSPTNHQSDSPNNQLRKRLRMKNNALYSSLSSSHFHLIPQQLQPVSTASQTFTKSTQFTETQVTSKSNDDVEQTEKRLREATVSQKEVVKPKPPQEKRLHLFNIRSDRIPPISRVDDDDDDDEEFKVNFVKPRAKTRDYDESNEISAIDKRKLSAMLSGLSGSVQETSKDTVDKPAPEAAPTVASTTAASISFTTSTTASTAAPITTPVTAINSLSGKSSLLVSPVKASETTTQPTTTASEAPKAFVGFQFGGTATAASSSLTAPSTPATTATSGRVSPLAVFSTPGSSNPTSVPSIDANKSLITFTPVAKPTVTTAQTTAEVSLAPSVTTTAPPSFGATPSFSFGNANKETPKLSVGFSFGSNSSSTPAFGGIAAPVSSTPVVSSAPAISSIPSVVTSVPSLLSVAPTISSTPVVASTTSAVAITSPPSFSFPTPSTNSFSFGAKPSASVAPSISGISGISSLSSSSGNLASTVSFAQKPETTTASGIGFSFSGNTAAAPTTTASSGFSFGSSQSGSALAALAPAPTTTASSFSFGASTNSAFGAPAPTATSTFGQPQAQTPVTAPPMFGQSASITPSFGQPAPNAAPSVFGQAASATPSFGQPAAAAPAPSFSGFGQPSAPQPAATGMFSFGQKASPAATPATTANSFSFGGSAPAAVTSASTFAFGQSNSNQPAATTASNSIFGRLGDKQTEAKPAFSFGGNTQQQPSAPSMFGGAPNNSVAAPATNMFGSMSSPSFGQTNNNQPANTNMFGNNSTPSNDFAAKPASGGIFSFGGATNNTPAPAPASAGVFSFGGGPGAPNNAPQSANVFGTSSSSQNVSASFTFKPSSGTVSTNQSPNVFGQTQNSNAPPSYQFGSNTANVSFTFGASAQTPQAAPQSGFNFSGPQSAPASGAFNFQGAAPALGAPQQPGGGLFNIGTGGNQQQRRPIRQAMRRMK